MDNYLINLLLLISVIFIGGHLSKDLLLDENSKIFGVISLGVVGGILAIGMMIYSIRIIGTNTLIDLRIIALMIVYYIGGLIPSIITGIITIIFRTIYYGFNNSSVIAIFQVIILIVLYYIVSTIKLDNLKKWISMFMISMFIVLSSLYYLLSNVNNVFGILMGDLFVSILAAILAYSLLQYVKSTNELYKRYKNEATKDFLTGLSNPREFDLFFNDSVAKAKEKSESLSCLMVDIDYFKNVNDTYGHAAGDIVLRDLSTILKKTCRIFDVVARVGGEEFCILLANCSQKRAVEIGEKICNEVKHHTFDIGDNRQISITVSVGVATYPDTLENIDMLLKQADDFLYKAKQTGRDRVCSAET